MFTKPGQVVAITLDGFYTRKEKHVRKIYRGFFYGSWVSWLNIFK